MTTNFSGSSDEVAALVIQPDGKIVAAGVAIVSMTGFDFALARYNSDGTLDSTFGSAAKSPLISVTLKRSMLLRSSRMVGLLRLGRSSCSGHPTLR